MNHLILYYFPNLYLCPNFNEKMLTFNISFIFKLTHLSLVYGGLRRLLILSGIS